MWCKCLLTIFALGLSLTSAEGQSLEGYLRSFDSSTSESSIPSVTGAADDVYVEEFEGDESKLDSADLSFNIPTSWLEPDRLQSTLQLMLLTAALSVAPAILLMTTCYVRVVVVLQILRQAIGMQQLPPTQVITTISLFITGLIMWPVWTDVYHEAIEPYQAAQGEMEIEEAWERGVAPIRHFMSQQIKATNNSEDVMLFYAYLPEGTPPPETFDDVPLQVLLPAFMLSELKTAFLIGFRIYLPFLIIDLVVSSVSVSTGMLMLPPSLVSLPLKLLLFVLVDGWRLVIGMLLESFVT